MFPDPDQCQQDAGMLEEGKHARDQAPALLSWNAHCAIRHPSHTHPAHARSHTHTTHTDGPPCIPHPLKQAQKHRRTHATGYTAPPQHTIASQVHINTCHHDSTHVHHMLTDTQASRETQIDGRMSHMHSGRSAAIGVEDKLRAPMHRIGSFFFLSGSVSSLKWVLCHPAVGCSKD